MERTINRFKNHRAVATGNNKRATAVIGVHRSRRVPEPHGFGSPTVAKSNSPSTDSGHNNEVLTASAPP